MKGQIQQIVYYKYFTEQLKIMEVQDLKQAHEQSANEQCPLCTGQNYAVMLNRALYDRYLANIDLYYTSQVDYFILEQITPLTCKFRQQLCIADDQQLLKRWYSSYQYPAKIQMLSQYYKFHRDVPKIFEKSVFKILGKHFDRLRHFDYKKIKYALKEQQGISLTTQKSDQTSFHSDDIIKSRYSTVLHDLDIDSQSQSRVLQDFCQKVDKAYENINVKKDFKGQYFSGQKKFQEYLLSMKKVNHKSSKVQFVANHVNQKVKNYNLLHKPVNYTHLNNLVPRNQKADAVRKKSVKKKAAQMLLQTNNALKQSLKNFKKIKKNSKSIQKTTANQTISREQKSKRMEKLQRTLEYQIQRNQNIIFKPLTAGLMTLKSNAMLRTLDEIYKPASTNQKYHNEKSQKISHQGTPNLQKLFENKLSGRKSVQKIKCKVTSLNYSKQINLNLKQNTVFTSNQKPQTQRVSNKKPEITTTKGSLTKQMARSKSVSRTLKTQMKSSQKLLNTIQFAADNNSKRGSTNKRIIGEKNRLSNYLNQKLLNLQSGSKAKELRQRSSSIKNLHSVKKQRSSSKKNIISTKRIQRSSSKSNVTSARASKPDKTKFHTIDPEANKNIENFLQRKLTIGNKAKPVKAKFNI